MGEPLNNADRVFEAVRLLNDPERLGIGARHITVSTSGVVPGMDRMVEELPQVNLAISLHAATDELRDELVPINRKWPIREVIAAGRRFAARTGRRVSLEYVMIDGLNDTEEQADGLIELARGWRSHVNLIPLNPTPGLAMERDAGRRDRAFRSPPARRWRLGHRPRHARPGDRRGLRSAPRAADRAISARGARGGSHGPGVVSAESQISASILTADFARLGDEVRRAANGGVESVHLDVMDGHFVDNLTLGPVVVGAVRPVTDLPFHTHLMISNPLAYVERFADAGSDLIVFHVEADDDPAIVIEAIERAGKRPGIALNPETAAEAVHPYLERVDLVLVMTVHPGWGGQPFIGEVLPKLSGLRDEIARRGLDVPIGVDGGVNLETIGAAHAAGGAVLVTGSSLYSTEGDLAPTVAALRAAALARVDTGHRPERT